jgi:hypothetical protein
MDVAKRATAESGGVPAKQADREVPSEIEAAPGQVPAGLRLVVDYHKLATRPDRVQQACPARCGYGRESSHQAWWAVVWSAAGPRSLSACAQRSSTKVTTGASRPAAAATRVAMRTSLASRPSANPVP